MGVMEREHICLLVFIAFLVVITLSFSGCVSNGGYSITYYAPYDSDNIPESNPTFENPLPYPFSINNASIVPVYIGVLVKKDQQPLPGENVTLDIWNEESGYNLGMQTNNGGYAVFFVAINVSENNATLYNYQVYLNRQENIATPIRFIVINTINPITENDGKKIRLEKKEWIQSGEPSGNTSILRIVYSVVTQQDIRDTYHFNVRDFDNQLIFEKQGPFSSTGNHDQQIIFDVPVQTSNRFQKLDINFTLEDPASLRDEIIIPSKGFSDLKIAKSSTFQRVTFEKPPTFQKTTFVKPDYPTYQKPTFDTPQYPTYQKPTFDTPQYPTYQKPTYQTWPTITSAEPTTYPCPYCTSATPTYQTWPTKEPDPFEPPNIPEGDNLIVVGILTMMLVVYVVFQRRDR